jgi:hypothetical protein
VELLEARRKLGANMSGKGVVVSIDKKDEIKSKRSVLDEVEPEPEPESEQDVNSDSIPDLSHLSQKQKVVAMFDQFLDQIKEFVIIGVNDDNKLIIYPYIDPKLNAWDFIQALHNKYLSTLADIYLKLE